MASLADFSATTLTGTEQHLVDHRGSVVLVVNTASRCGFTPQYAGLQELHERYSARGLDVLGFPCDQFMHQEPGTEREIAEFCQVNYGVTFQMFSKIDVNGEHAHPLYQWLTGPHPAPAEASGLPGPAIGGAEIEWNFTKFLLGRDGTVLRRYAPGVEPADLAGDIEAALAADA